MYIKYCFEIVWIWAAVSPIYNWLEKEDIDRWEIWHKTGKKIIETLLFVLYLCIINLWQALLTKKFDIYKNQFDHFLFCSVIDNYQSWHNIGDYWKEKRTSWVVFFYSLDWDEQIDVCNHWSHVFQAKSKWCHIRFTGIFSFDNLFNMKSSAWGSSKCHAKKGVFHSIIGDEKRKCCWFMKKTHFDEQESRKATCDKLSTKKRL